MSHIATNWAMAQKGLKPAAKIVLFHLSDRHNPDYGCFPSQATLANDCEMSRRSIQNHLADLEARGFIRRERRLHKGSYTSDRYFLAFEVDFEVSPCANIATGKNGLFTGAKSAHGQAQNLRTNLVSINPVKEPVIPPLIPQGGAGMVISKADLILEFERLYDFYPRHVGRGAAEKAFFKARKIATLAEIAKPLAEFKQNINGTPMDKIPHCSTWLNQKRWLDNQSHAANRPKTASDDLAGLGVQSSSDDLGKLFSQPLKIEGSAK